MKLRGRMVCIAFLAWGLAWPNFVGSQVADPAANKTSAIASRPQATQSPEQSGPRFPCAEPTDRKAASARREAALAKLPDHYRYWLIEDVRYLISPEERCAFLILLANDEREQFIEQFWYRRSANPESPDDEFKTEHYRRIVFANENFGSDIPGWETDRGHIYVLFGPPDRVVSHPKDESAWKPPEGAPDIPKYSWESWHYKNLEGMGNEADLEFVDPAGSGMYSLLWPQQDENELLFNPVYNLGRNPTARPSLQTAGRIYFHVGPAPAPRLKYMDLEAVVVSHIVRDQVHFTYRVEFARATHATTLAWILMDLPRNQLTIPDKDQDTAAGYAIFGRISKQSGRVASTFERAGELRELEENGREDRNRKIAVPLEPGSYQLALVVKDVATGNVGVTRTTIEVPDYEALK